MQPNKLSYTRKGELVARLLSRAWRRGELTDLDFSEHELDEVTPLLFGSGGAALGWRRVAETHLRDTASAKLLHQAYRLHSLQATIHEQKIVKVFGWLRAAKVDAVLGKGFVAARMYAETGLRPYGDLDLLVRQEHLHTAKEVLAAPEASDCSIDLHQQFHEINERTFDEIFERSRLERLGGEPIRVFGAEDHMALLCLHFLRHGAWRPIWLCDIGAAVETLPAGFDWKVCLGSDQKRASWIVSAIGLAGTLLNAEPPALSIQNEIRLPEWFRDTVLRQWAHPFAIDQPPTNHPVPISYHLRHPTGLLEGLRKRWPNAIVATISVNGEINDLPRLPYQLANWMARMGQVMRRQGS